MSAMLTSPYHGFPYPEATDTVDLPAHLVDPLLALELRTCLYVATYASIGTIDTTGQDPGMLCYAADVERMFLWDGVSWVDLYQFQAKPSVKARKTANSTIGDGDETAFTTITLSASDVWDTDNMHDPSGASPTKITIPTTLGGRWRVDVLAVWSDGTAGGTRGIRLKYNDGAGGYDIMSIIRATASADASTYHAATNVYEYAGDTEIEVQVMQSSGASLTLAQIEIALTYEGA